MMNSPVVVKNYKCKDIFRIITNGNDEWEIFGIYGIMYFDGYQLNKQKAIQIYLERGRKDNMERLSEEKIKEIGKSFYDV